MKHEVKNYSALTIGFHWLVAVMICAMLVLGFYMSDLALTPYKLKLFSYHKWAGMTVLLLTTLRLLWRLARPLPPDPHSMKRWEIRSARLAHGILYLLMFAIPLTGWLMSSAKGFPTVLFTVWQLPDLVAKNKELGNLLKDAHENLNYLLLATLGLHVLAALRHQFILRDGILAKMIPFLR